LIVAKSKAQSRILWQLASVLIVVGEGVWSSFVAVFLHC